MSFSLASLFGPLCWGNIGRRDVEAAGVELGRAQAMLLHRELLTAAAAEPLVRKTLSLSTLGTSWEDHRWQSLYHVLGANCLWSVGRLRRE